MSKIKITRGDTVTIEVSFVDSSNDPIDLTSGTIYFTVNSDSAPTSDASAVIQKTVSSFSAPTTGVQNITLSTSETDIDPGIYYYDAQFVSAGSTLVLSSVKDKFVVISDITRTT